MVYSSLRRCLHKHIRRFGSASPSTVEAGTRSGAASFLCWPALLPTQREVIMAITTLDIAIIGLLVIISAVGITTRSSRVPYPVALVIAGLALGVLLHSPLPFVRDLRLDVI